MARGITGREGNLFKVDFGAGSIARESRYSSHQQFDPVQLPQLVQEAYQHNMDDETAMRSFPLSFQGIRLVEPIYLLFFPQLLPHQLLYIGRIQGIKQPVDSEYPLVIQRQDSQEYALRIKNSDTCHGTKHLDVAIPKNSLEEMLAEHDGFQRPFDMIVITAAPVYALRYNQRKGRVVVYVPNVSTAESVHPHTVQLRSRAATIKGRITRLRDHERVFDYNPAYHSL